MLDRRHHAPIGGKPHAHGARYAKQRRAAEGLAIGEGWSHVLAVMDGAAEAALDEEVGRHVDRPGQACISKARPAVEIHAAADMRTGNEIAGEKVRCGKRLRKKNLAREIGGAVATLRTPGILRRQTKTEF